MYIIYIYIYIHTHTHIYNIFIEDNLKGIRKQLRKFENCIRHTCFLYAGLVGADKTPFSFLIESLGTSQVS